uniref:WRKY domain-containing protein n=1 Tax=Leersia perrieri TaxID=77586 RepID=A0A0D9XWA2_9ORYZ
MKNKRSLVADQSRVSSVNFRAALSEIAREQSLVTQLRAIVLPALQSDERCDIAAHMLEGILDCSRKAISQLQLQLQLQLSSDSPHNDDDDHVDDERRVRKIVSSSDDDGCSSKAADENQNAKPIRQHKRRRFGDSVSLETPVPHYDGHQWRKYGQKHINNAKHPRSYYRCTYRQEEKCKATKTVQQREELHYANSNNGDHPIMYTVVYYGQHTCCKVGPASADDHAVVEASQISNESHCQSPSSSSSDLQPAQAGDSSQGSNITVTCSTSVVVEDCNKLLDMLPAADELTTDVLLFDMTAYAPLDLDINWEMDTNALWV